MSRGDITAGPWGFDCRGVGGMDILRGGSSSLPSSGAPTWEDVSTGLGKSSGLGGRSVPKSMGSSLFGVELPDACPEVSNTARDRSSLTSMVMLTCPSAFGRGGLMGLAVRMGID